MCRRYLFILFVTLAFHANGQYYYRDILANRQTQRIWKSYYANKVAKVDIQSLESNGEPTPDFACNQTVSRDFRTIETFTQSTRVQASDLQTRYDESGRVVETVDSSDTYKSTTDYTYDAAGNLILVVNRALETDNQLEAVESHYWYYEHNRPVRMVKIKGKSDTTIVAFKSDDKGNIVQETATHRGDVIPDIYYYYDDQRRLTDVVRYNEKAARLLPDYMFEYGAYGIASMLYVPPGSSAYQKWIYDYDQRGLKTAETCYNKKREILGRMTFQYTLR